MQFETHGPFQPRIVFRERRLERKIPLAAERLFGPYGSDFDGHQSRLAASARRVRRDCGLRSRESRAFPLDGLGFGAPELDRASVDFANTRKTDPGAGIQPAVLGGRHLKALIGRIPPREGFIESARVAPGFQDLEERFGLRQQLLTGLGE